MAGDRRWIPDDIDPGRPSIARIYDYALGGGHNLACDRAVFYQMLEIQPNIRELAWNNRAFMRRVVLFMVKSGVRQFLDLGSGIPTVGNVHEIAQKVDAACRVVYVDREEVAVAHSRLLLEDDPLADMVDADIARPDQVLGHPNAVRLLDYHQPIGLLALTVGQYIPDNRVVSVFDEYRAALASGSMLGISHGTDDFEDVNTHTIFETAAVAGGDRMSVRTKAEILRLFGDFELVEPGLVAPSKWRPDSPPPTRAAQSGDGMWAGVGTKLSVTTAERIFPDR
ncbi:SAM-dependent methyltransferase [Actinocrispum wychmicini]|uniref:S-adenosyl methyltransferase n=1 Tax=Actinocrispum wychmicini TaxID=1213861 RepID=A0A4R2KH58_9PSEU|nr:SAM-dependent methyltransferase [Actinocrispum wychmicini]TCO65775.1 S-adenosyl methyltransferase [Actinocrispum wychmicini]